MKIEELMVGDWYYWEAEGKKYPYQIRPEDFINGDVCNFEPIPLTPDILERNGWILDEIDGSYSNWEDGIWLGGEEAPFSVSISPVCVGINYVHELQHVLRDAKIKKEIIIYDNGSVPSSKG